MGWFFPEAPKKPAGNSKPEKQNKIGKRALTERQAKEEFNRVGSTMPSHARHFSGQRIREIQREVFNPKYGSASPKYKCQKRIEELQGKARKAKAGPERSDIQREIGLLKEMKKRMEGR